MHFMPPDPDTKKQAPNKLTILIKIYKKKKEEEVRATAINWSAETHYFLFYDNHRVKRKQIKHEIYTSIRINSRTFNEYAIYLSLSSFGKILM